jgi:hypothetical protein
MKYLYATKDETAIRTPFRVMGAFVLLVLAAMTAAQAYFMISRGAATFVQGKCGGRGRIVCEIVNWLDAATPSAIQFPLEVALRIFVALALLYVAIRLVLPRRAKSEIKPMT